MKTTRTRLTRLETARDRHLSRRSRHGGRPLAVRIACAHLALQPDLPLVTAADTDEETYRDIREMLAYARHDFIEAERLANARPWWKPSREGLSAEEELREALSTERVSEVTERKSAAIEAARARLARAGSPAPKPREA